MASKTADRYKLVLRLPKPLHKRLKQQARRNDVSLNTEIVNQLEGRETLGPGLFSGFIQEEFRKVLEHIYPEIAEKAAELATQAAVKIARENRAPIKDISGTAAGREAAKEFEEK